LKTVGYDLFVSYRHADGGPVRVLVEALRQQGLRVWFDDTAIPNFAGITAEASRGIDTSKALLVYYSAKYPQSRACQWELTTAFVAAQRHGDPRARIVVVNPEAGPDHIEPVELRDARYYPAPADGQGVHELVTAVAVHLASLEQPLGSTTSSGLWVPAAAVSAPRFVGRIRDMWRVHSALAVTEAAMTQAASGPGVAVVSGMGGVGKSLLVQEYALRFGGAYPGGVFWLRAGGSEDPATFDRDEMDAQRQAQLRQFARVLLGAERMHLLEGMTPEDVDAVVRTALATRGPCLWIVDDLPSGLTTAQLSRWLGPPPARTIITTRSGEYGGLPSIPLGRLEHEDAVQLLTARRRPAQAPEAIAAEEIVEDLGCHALAVDVASAAARLEGYVQLRDGLRDLSADELELAAGLRDELPTGHERSIAATLNRSIQRLGKSGMDLLRLAASLAPEPIPEGIISAVFAAVDNLDERETRWRSTQALDDVASMSLAEEAMENAWRVHELVSRTMLLSREPGVRRGQLRAAAVDVIASRIQSSAGIQAQIMDLDTHTQLSPLLPHARWLTRAADSEPTAWLVGLLARYYHAAGSLLAAEAHWRRQLDANQSLYGEEDLRTLVTMTFLAEVLGQRGALEEAIRLQKTALAAFREQVGQDDPRTLGAINSLGLMLYAQGNVADGSDLLRQAVEARARVMGPEHRDTLDSMSYLADVLAEQGELPEAELLGTSVVLYRSQTLGDHHVDTLDAMASLAGILHESGRLEDSLELHSETLQGRLETLGEDSPKTLDSMHDVARTLKALANLDEMAGQGDSDRRRALLESARELNARVLERRRQLLGDDATKTLASASNLANVMHTLGDVDAAHALSLETLETHRRVFGPEHPRTLTTLNNIAVRLYQTGDLQAASETMANVLDARLRVLGESHPDTLQTMSSLGAIFIDIGDLARAIDLGERAVTGFKRVLGPRHPLTKQAFLNLISALGKGADQSTTRAVIARVAPNGPGEFFET
jgi:tetratricopeptide (TPR) repeat protein